MALFAAPLAHEDRAVRACYAALAIQDGPLPCRGTARMAWPCTSGWDLTPARKWYGPLTKT
jgi:hypothetical protein